MRIKTVSYQKIFPTGMAYLNHKIGIEIELDKDDCEESAFKVAKEKVEQWNLESNPSYSLTMEYMKPSEISSVVTQSEKENKDERISSFIATINMCTSLKFLRNFAARVTEENNSELSQAYLAKEIELSDKTKRQ